MTRRLQIIQLGWSHYAVFAASLLLLFAVVWLLSPWQWEQEYVERALIPRIQARYGFQCGTVEVRRPGTPTLWAITKVIPGERLARLGVRAGDLPFEYHGGGWVVMHDALMAAERGRFAKFDVINAYDYRDGKKDGGSRTIVTNPPNTELATEFFGLSTDELPDPAGRRTLESVRADEAVASNAPNQLWVRDVATGTRTKVYSYHHVDVGVVWSTDGRWLAVTDYYYTSVSNVARCVLLDTEGGAPADLSKAISRFDATTNRHMSGNKDVQCNVFGWIRGTSRVALTITGQGRADPFGFRQDFFYDVATRKLLAVP